MKGISLRHATPEDWPAIEALHKEQQAVQGTDYELPRLFELRSVPVILVGCDHDGKILNCIYVEATAELRFVGCSNPKATAIGQRAADGLCFLLKQMGFRFLECYVPQQLKRYIEKPLKRAGFEDKGAELAYFSRDLR